MKTAQELVEGLERVERQEHPSDKVRAWEEFVADIQRDARQDAAEAILERVAAAGIDVTDCDGDDDPAIILADWVVGRIEGLMEYSKEMEQRCAELKDAYDADVHGKFDPGDD